MNDRIEELINLWCDNQCDEHQVKELEAFLRQDPAVRRLLVQRIDQHHALMDLLSDDPTLTAQVAATVPAETQSATTQTSTGKLKRPTTGRFIHSRSFHRRKKSPPSFALAASIACAILLLIGVVFWQRQNATIPVAWVSNSETQDIPIYKNHIIDAVSSTQIRFADGSIVSCTVGSQAVLDFSSGKMLTLTHGSISASVEPQDRQFPFRIVTPHALFTVIGTSFQITSSDTQTDLIVHHGSVRVNEDGKAERFVTDGEEYLAGKPRAIESSNNHPLITDNTMWHYYDRKIAPPAEWNTEQFDDSAWPQGLAPFGYDVNDDDIVYKTSIDPEGSRSDDNLAVWFRATFDYQQQDSLNYLIGKVIYDDGVVIYINGKEVTRMNIPPGPISGTTSAYNNRKKASIITTNLSIPASYLKSGKNTLAVSIHQRAKDSTDVYFKMVLTATHVKKESP